MAHTATYQLRIDDEIKRESFAVFHELGMTPAEGMRMFLTLVAKTKSIPFPVEYTPNKKTAKILLANQETKKYQGFDNLDDLFADLDS